MKEGAEVTLADDVPRPEEWAREAPNSYYYVHEETGDKIHEQSYYAKLKQRQLLSGFIEEVESVGDEDIDP